jgi:hypothetical protein
MGQIPLDQQVGRFSTPDVLIHTWDLAKAAGIDETSTPTYCKRPMTPWSQWTR